MLEYNKVIIEIKNPQENEIVSKMDSFGSDGWDIFSIHEKVVEAWESYGEQNKIVQFTLYMKRIKELCNHKK